MPVPSRLFLDLRNELVAALEQIPAFASSGGRALLIESVQERQGAFSLREQATARLSFMELAR